MKAKDTVEIDVRGKTSIADYLVVASGTSTRHVKSVADEVVQFAKKCGVELSEIDQSGPKLRYSQNIAGKPTASLLPTIVAVFLAFSFGSYGTARADKVDDLIGRLAERATEAERLRRLPDATLAEAASALLARYDEAAAAGLAQESGTREGAVAIRDDAPVYSSANGDKVEWRLKRGDAVAGQIAEARQRLITGLDCARYMTLLKALDRQLGVTAAVTRRETARTYAAGGCCRQ